ncbi:uncharacterized protein LOC105700192 [Orussus abietinus]|uniref:uncharacterized protein LOC105700192 n=1 Tax=Orussus abietinus TaxID=222816 RepID=UPI0006260503|nr:uncharacterized protein LOC105700192 [Orussus abietinus]
MQFYSLLNMSGFLSTHHFLRNEDESTRQDAKIDFLSGYLILLWVIFYLIYKKCLNMLLRRMCIPLMQRNRIISGIWNCGFCFSSICYLKFPMSRTSTLSSLRFDSQWQELGSTFHKSFYIHHAGVELFCNGDWMKGWTQLLFALFIIKPYLQKPYPIVANLLLHKAIDILTVDSCRIILSGWQKKTGKIITKLLFLFHCINWMYLYILLIPGFLLGSHVTSRIEFFFWMWFMLEILNSVIIKLFGSMSSNHWLECCIFPPPSQEVMQLASIRKRHQNSLKSNTCPMSSRNKIQLQQMLHCAMAIKRKVKKLREAKHQINTLQSPEEDSITISDGNNEEKVSLSESE